MCTMNLIVVIFFGILTSILELNIYHDFSQYYSFFRCGIYDQGHLLSTSDFKYESKNYKTKLAHFVMNVNYSAN